MYQVVASDQGNPHFHVLGPDGEIRLANASLKSALRIAARLQEEADREAAEAQADAEWDAHVNA